jgi:hypothetical protein
VGGSAVAVTAAQLKHTIEVSYAPQGETLRAFHLATDYIRILIGPLGSGKTFAAIQELLKCIDNQSPDKLRVRRSRWAAVRNTQPDLQGTTIKDFCEVVDPLGIGKFTDSSPPRYDIRYMRKDRTIVEAEVRFLALDIPKDEKKARGWQLSGLWLNEMSELNETNCNQLMGRVGRYPRRQDVPDRKSHIIGDTNAPDRDHWLGKLVKEVRPSGWWFGVQPPAVIKVGGKWRTNPRAENLSNHDPAYYDRQLSGKKESWIRKNLANEFVFHTDGRPIHPDFNEDFHVCEYELEPTYGLPLHIGIDFGRTPAALIMQRQVTGQWYALRELCTVNTNAKVFGRVLRKLLNEEYDGFDIVATGDPAGDDMPQTEDDTPMDKLAEEGIECYPAYTNDFEERITALDDLLGTMIGGQPAFIVSPRCTTFIKGLAGAYQFKRIQVAGDDRFHDKPLKSKESHVCEACHYGLMGAGEGEPLFNQSGGGYDSEESWAPPDEYFE